MPSSAWARTPAALPPLPTRRSSDLHCAGRGQEVEDAENGAAGTRRRHRVADAGWSGVLATGVGRWRLVGHPQHSATAFGVGALIHLRSEEHTSELQSPTSLVCRLLLGPGRPRRYHLSLHDALPICTVRDAGRKSRMRKMVPPGLGGGTGLRTPAGAASSLPALDAGAWSVTHSTVLPPSGSAP